ncbi:MAG: RAD55 family ATPase [Thermoproteus sp.]
MDLKGITLVYGRPGTGKTTFAAHIAAERLRRGEKVLWVSFYEDRDTLVKDAAALGYDLSKAHIWDAVLAKAEDVFNYVVALATEEGPSLLVLDSISQLQGLDVRGHLTNVMYRALKPTGVDILLTAEEEGADPLSYIADNIIHLVRRVSERGIPTRYMDFEKMRGRPAGFVKAFEIVEGVGLVLLDELKPARRRAGQPLATDTCVDTLLGPLEPGSVTVFVAPATASYLKFLARTAANISKRGATVLFAARGVDPLRFHAYVERLGGKVVARRVEVRPDKYWWLTYGLYKAIEEVRPDVLITDWLDVEFALLGQDLALETFRRNSALLRDAGIPLIVSVSEERGLSAYADNAAVFYEEGGALYARPLKVSSFEASADRCRAEPP